MCNTDEIRKDERRKILEKINECIKPGDLQGNGFDKTAERNGLILAANIIHNLLMPKR